MSYVTYNLPLHRTGFRPYGLTNTWSATQLNGVGHMPPFTERGGWPLGQIQRGFSPRFLLPTGPRLSGLGQMACDPTDPLGACYDPTVFVPPSSVSASPIPAIPPDIAAPTEPAWSCVDVDGIAVNCSDPNCVSGPCVTPSGTYSPTARGSSPRVVAPTTLFPPTAGASAIPPRVNCPSGYAVNAQGQCAPSVWTQLQPYLPLVLVAVVGVALLGGKK